MNFNCNKKDFLKALTIAQKAISTKSTNKLLEGISIKAEDNKVTLLATNIDLTIQTDFECTVFDKGEIVVEAALLIEIIRRLPDELVVVKIIKENIIEIVSGKSNFSLVFLDSNDFPKIPEHNKIMNLTLNGEIFKNMIRGTTSFASLDEARPVLNGVLFEIINNRLNMVASDGFRLALKTNAIGNIPDISVIIPSKALDDMYKIIDDEDIDIQITRNHIIVKQNNNIIISRLIEGEFLKYEAIFPKESNLSIEVNRDTIIDAIERAAIVIKEGNAKLIKFSIKDGIMNISSNSALGKVTEDIEVVSTGKELTIAFNSKYIVEAVKKIEDEILTMEYSSPFTPVLIKSSDNDNSKYLVLPVRLVEE